MVSDKELKKIEAGKTSLRKKCVEPVPYKAILTSVPVWGVWICCIGATFGYQIFVQYGPIYLNKVLEYEITNTGFMTAFPNVIAAVFKILGGPISDLATCISPKSRVKVFTAISQGVMALSFVCLALIPPSLKVLGQVAYTAAVAFSSLMWVGPVRSGAMVARQHAHFVLAIISFINSAGIIILPPIVSWIAPNNTASQWSILLFGICASVVICTIVFSFVGEADPAEWTKSNSSSQVPPTTLSETVQQRDGAISITVNENIDNDDNSGGDVERGGATDNTDKIDSTNVDSTKATNAETHRQMLI
ncbi:hypothetical protein AB6A40_009239 [Gnathostoma spinigerum]|uniref:Uncharacterized protein n=1 Tax=Gnathostoma spinigerum TaxID=75299 RepID=A0ABD6F188_9BILA